VPLVYAPWPPAPWPSRLTAHSDEDPNTALLSTERNLPTVVLCEGLAVHHADNGRLVELALEQLHQTRLNFRVKRGGCFIEYRDRRLLNEQAGKRDALLLAPR
jgi:hypothetical protein